MDGTSVLGIKDDTVENVKIEGFVFIGSRQHSLWANKPGSITFKDCEFRVRIRYSIIIHHIQYIYFLA